MKTETEESLPSSVNHENADGSTSWFSTAAEEDGTDRSFFFRHLFCFCWGYVTNFQVWTSDDGNASVYGRMANRFRLGFCVTGANQRGGIEIATAVSLEPIPWVDQAGSVCQDKIQPGFTWSEPAQDARVCFGAALLFARLTGLVR